MKHALARRRLSGRALMWLCVAGLLLSLMPLYALSAYNHACYDDFGFSILTHDAWRETGSFRETVRAAVQNTVGIRNTWEGTYTTSFLSALQPALFNEDLYWVTTALLMTFLLFALWFFLRQALVRGLGADRQAFWTAFCAVTFVMVQFVPELSEAFFWFNGGVAYTLMWAVALVRLGVWLCFERAKRRGAKAALYALLLLLTVAVGGAKYSTLLLCLLVDALMAARALLLRRRDRVAETVLFVLLLACFAFSASAPGNAVRAATLSGGMSAPKAVLQAFYFGLALMGHWFSLPLLVVWALVAWQLSEAIRGCPCRFGHPVWITVLSVCLFCAQLAPTLYTGNYLGDGRALNTYFYTFVLMSCALVLYWLGWAQRRAEDRLPFAAIGSARRDGLRIGAFAAALVLLVVGCVSYRPDGSEDWGIRNMASGSAARSLLSGQAAAYDAAMDARDDAMNDPENACPVLVPVDDVPDAFMGDALNADNLDYVLSLYAEYYQKQQVTAAKEE